MTGRLWFKLMGAFVLVIAVGILVTVWVAGQSAATQFSHVMVNGRPLDPAALVTSLAESYTHTGGWREADLVLDGAVGSAPTGRMGSGMGGMMESAMEKQMHEGWAAGAEFTNRWIAAGKAPAP